MLKFLTHKLRTHSLNEDNVSEKVEERDSGTESDDEADRDTRDSCADVIMKWSDVTDLKTCDCACGTHCDCAARAPDLLYDHHSSEEELEVINGAESACAGAGAAPGAAAESRRRGASSPPPAGAAPEKRKWARDRDPPRPTSDDDDDTKVETPVRFRTSPPLEALKPRRSGAGAGIGAVTGVGAVTSAGAVSGAEAVAAADCGCGAQSPRRRRQPAPPPRRHRPALDFDKMQQLKVGGAGVRSWRGAGGAGGELSVFCW